MSDIASVKTIVLSPGAAKAFDKMAASVQLHVAGALHGYAIDGVGDVKAMVDAKTVRLRVGDFRVIFDEDAKRILVLALGHRKDIYR